MILFQLLPIFVVTIFIGVILLFIFKNMKMNRNTLQSFQKIGLALSIILVLNLLFNYGIFTFYPSPEFDNFCGSETRQNYTTKDSCEEIGGEWVANVPFGVDSRIVEKPISIDPNAPTEYCNATASCREAYNDARSVYNRNVFIGLVILATISVGLGLFLVDVSAISFGFLYGGLLSYFIATTRYWSDMDERVRLVVLLVALGVLIALGYRKLKDK